MNVNLKILIVEDSSASRFLMSKIVRSILPNVELVTAENGRTALMQIASGSLYDLIILDLGLPDIGGLKILDICREIKIQSPIITISDESSQNILKKSIELGASEYLTKPIMRAQFYDCIIKYIKIEERVDNRRILIVDDEQMNRLILNRILSKAGYAYMEATNGFEAVKMVTENSFDCILMDIRMPFMDGIEASRKIHRDYPDIPIIVITAEPLELVKEREFDAGIDVYLGKPINKNELLEAIEIQISYREQKREAKFNSTRIPNQKQDKSNHAILEDFMKFVPRNFLGYDGLNKKIKRGLIEVVDCSVIFIDIRDFTTMTENMSAEQCFNFLNSYFELIEPIIQSFGGMVYQFLGDGIVCVFPLYRGKYTNNVVHAAISIQDQICIYNKGRIRAGYTEIRIGCGVSTGPLAMGVCGSNARYEVGAFGTTMNIAARCQSACRDFGIDITITSKTFKRLDNLEGFLIRPIGTHKLKGMKDKVPLYEVFSHNTPLLRKNKCDCLDLLSKYTDLDTDLPLDLLIKEFPNDPLWEKLKRASVFDTIGDAQND